MKMMKRMRMLLLLAAALMFFMPGKVSASGWMNQKKPYQYNGVTEYLPNQDQYFDIGGNRYDEGYVFYLWNAAGTAQVLYNLKDGYTNFAFKVGHIDNTKSYTAELKIYLDGILSQTVELKPTDIAKNVSVDLTGVKHMKILMTSQEALNHYDITYGIYDGVFVESGNEIVTATASNMVGNKEPYQKEGDKTEVVKKIQMAGDSFEDCLQMYLWNPASSSKIYFNFNGTYKSMSFLAGHIDNTAVINAKLEITVDGEVWDTVPLTADGLPVPVTVPLENAYQMVLSLQSDAPLNSYDIYYGIGGIQLVSDGKVTGVTLNQASATLTDANPSMVLKPTVVPADADVANVIWSSSDSGIVSVDQNGVVKAVSKGNAVITVQTEDGGFKAQCVVVSELSQAAGQDASSSETEGNDGTEQPATTEDAGRTEQPATTEDAGRTEQPVTTEDAGRTEQPATTEDAAGTEQSVTTEDGARTEQPADSGQGQEDSKDPNSGKVSASGWMNQKKPYQYNGVTEYLPNQDQYFDIGGNRYDEGYVFYLWNAAGTAQVLYNLKDGYTNFAFKVGHIDNTKSYTAELKIYLDGILSQTVELKPTDIAKNVSVDLTGVKHMKILMASQEALNHYDITYGIYDGVFVESGKEIVTATASNMVGNKEPYQKEGDKTEVVKKIQMAGDSFEDCLQMYLWNPASSSKIYFNFNGTYKSMSFLAGHIDNTAVINAKLEITIDGEVWDTVPLTADGLPVPVTVPLENAYQMVLSLQSDAPLNSYDIYYGIGGIQLVSDGKVTGVTLNQSSVTLTDANPSVVLKPTVVPADADVANVIWSSSDSGIVTVDQNGVIKAVSKGNAVITVQTEDGGFKAQCVVASELSQSAGRDSSPADTEDDSKPEKKPAVAIYLNKKECVVRKGDTEQFSVTVLPVDATDQITFVSSDKEIAAVSESGLLTAKRAGSATITAKAESGVSSECSVKVIQKLDGFKIIGLYDAKYTGQKITQKFSVTDGIDVLKENVDYTVSYKNNEDVGTATVTVSGTGFYEGTVSADFQITGSGAEAKQEAAPAKVKISSLRNKKSKSFTVTWKALKVKGYEVQYAQNKQFTKGKKTKTTAKSTLTVKKLKKGKKYYVRVRAYIVDSGKDKIYGAWSAVKKVKITK